MRKLLILVCSLFFIKPLLAESITSNNLNYGYSPIIQLGNLTTPLLSKNVNLNNNIESDVTLDKKVYLDQNGNPIAASDSNFANSIREGTGPLIDSVMCDPGAELQKVTEFLSPIAIKLYLNYLYLDPSNKVSLKLKSLVYVECNSITLTYFTPDGGKDFNLNFHFVDVDLTFTLNGKSFNERFVGTLSIEKGHYDKWSNHSK